MLCDSGLSKCKRQLPAADGPADGGHGCHDEGAAAGTPEEMPGFSICSCAEGNLQTVNLAKTTEHIAEVI